MKDKAIRLDQEWLTRRVGKALRWGISDADAATLSAPASDRIEQAKRDALAAAQSLVLQAQIEALIFGDETSINWETLWDLTETGLTC